MCLRADQVSHVTTRLWTLRNQGYEVRRTNERFYDQKLNIRLLPAWHITRHSTGFSLTITDTDTKVRQYLKDARKMTAGSEIQEILSLLGRGSFIGFEDARFYKVTESHDLPNGHIFKVITPIQMEYTEVVGHVITDPRVAAEMQRDFAHEADHQE